MIEHSIVAADIMPAAAHLCASQLSSVHPKITFDHTRVYTMPYGTGTADALDRRTYIGSLELIAAGQSTSLFATGQRQASGEQEDLEVRDIKLPRESVDLVIMNPPFTRPTNHEATNVPVPSFAGFRTTEEEQRAMSAILQRIREGINEPAGHGNAGLASNFIDLAHAKIKHGGVIAFVLPIAAIQGSSWSDARDLLARRYCDITVVTIATSGTHARAFSADTGMAETLIVATKRSSEATTPSNVLFLNLRRRPSSLLEAAEVAKLLKQLPSSPLVGHLPAGNQDLGNYIRAPLSEGGCAALREPAIADVMMALRRGELRTPAKPPPPKCAHHTDGQSGPKGAASP